MIPPSVQGRLAYSTSSTIFVLKYLVKLPNITEVKTNEILLLRSNRCTTKFIQIFNVDKKVWTVKFTVI